MVSVKSSDCFSVQQALALFAKVLDTYEQKMCLKSILCYIIFFCQMIPDMKMKQQVRFLDFFFIFISQINIESLILI